MAHKDGKPEDNVRRSVFSHLVRRYRLSHCFCFAVYSSQADLWSFRQLSSLCLSRLTEGMLELQMGATLASLRGFQGIKLRSLDLRCKRFNPSFCPTIYFTKVSQERWLSVLISTPGEWKQKNLDFKAIRGHKGFKANLDPRRLYFKGGKKVSNKKP